MNTVEPLARARTLEWSLLGIIALNAVLSLVMGYNPDAWIAPVAVPLVLVTVGLLAVQSRWNGNAKNWLLAAPLCASVVSVMHFGGLRSELSMGGMIALSLLVGLRNWRLMAAATAVFCAAELLLPALHGGLRLPDLQRALQDPLSLRLAAFLVQGSFLSYLAHWYDFQERERFDVEFLVRAMGASGVIRLNLDVLKAESPLGQRLHQVQERMAQAMLRVAASTAGVHRASEVMKDSGSELRERTEQSACGLRDVAMCLEQISVIVKANADAAQDARKISDDAATLANAAGASIGQMVTQMGEIDRSSRKITEIIGVIDSIAFQTNILALNAAVEAARAGEQGRGFAVVAAEVRNLAKRSSTAAGEIKSLIGESMISVENGNHLASTASATMAELVGAVRGVNAVFNSLSADTHENANSIEAVNTSVRELDQITRQNVQLSERADDIAHDLLIHADGLSEVLGTFKLSGSVATASASTTATTSPVASPARARPEGAASKPAAAAAPAADKNAAAVEFF